MALIIWTALPIVHQLRVAAHLGGAFTGVEGLYPPDQFQYLTWIRDAGTHTLIGDHYQILGPPHYDYLQPMFMISGLSWRLGLSLPVAYLIWSPVAVMLTWWSFRALVRRHLSGWSAGAAIVLGLCYTSPFAAATLRQFNPSGNLAKLGYDVSDAVALWGYFPRAIAVALLAALLLALEPIVEPSRCGPGKSVRFYVIAATGAACLTAWLHPWQGCIAFFIIVGIALWSPTRRRLLLLSLPAAGAILPLLYYEALLHYDVYWRVGSAQNHLPVYAPLALAATFLPLALSAVCGARLSLPRSTHRRMLLLWVMGTGVSYFTIAGVPLHVLDGLTLPLGIFAVDGWKSLRARLSSGRLSLSKGRPRLSTLLAVAGVGICTAPGLYYFARMTLVGEAHTPVGTTFTASDNQALNYLNANRQAGAVLASPYIAEAVPPFTGRSTYEGHGSWTPQYPVRALTAWALFRGALPPKTTRRVIETMGARFVLVDCHTSTSLPSMLGNDIVARHPFGCAAVYQLRPFATNVRALEVAEGKVPSLVRVADGLER